MPFDFIPESRSISLGIPIVTLPIKGSATVQWVKSPECLDLAAHHRGDFHDPGWIGAGRTQIPEVLRTFLKILITSTRLGPEPCQFNGVYLQ